MRDSFCRAQAVRALTYIFIQVRALADKFHAIARNVKHAESIEKIIMDTTNCLCGFWKHRAELEKTFPEGIPYVFPELVDLAKHLVRESFQEPYQVTLHVLPNDLARSVCSRVATTFERMLLLLHKADCTAPAFRNCHKNIKVRNAQCFPDYDVLS